MFYSTRHFIRIVITLLLIFFLLTYLPRIIQSIQSIIFSITNSFDKLIRVFKNI